MSTKTTLGKRGPLQVPADAWALAVRREEVVRVLAEQANPGRAAVAAAASKLGLSVPTIYRLASAFRANPVTSALVGTPPGPKVGTRRLPAQVEALIEAGIEKVYLSREKPRLSTLYQHVRHDCRAAGLEPPSKKALAARVSSRSLKERVKAREGKDAARDRFTPAVGGIRTEHPLQMIQIDHTLVDIQLVDELHRLVLGRPWLTLVLELHTRCVLGFYVSLDAPAATSVAMSVSHAVLPKKEWLEARGIGGTWPMHGRMGTIHLDNAAEFHSQALTRGCQQHGIRLAYRDRGTPHHGGHIERLMGTLLKRIHALPGTTFSNVQDRGAYESEKRAVLTLPEFERILALEVVGSYHNDIHTGIGKTPAAAWAEWLADGGKPAIPVNPAAFTLDFLPFEMRVVGRSGVRLFNLAYYDGALATLIGTSARLRVKYDPRDLSAVFVELPSADHIRTPYADLRRPPISLWEHRQAVRKLRADGRRSVDEEAIFAAVAEQRAVVADAYERSKAARRDAARAVHGRQVGMPGKTLPTAPGPLILGQAEDDDAKVPTLTEEDFRKMEFWS